MEKEPGIFEPLIEKGIQYGQTTFDLLKLKTIDKSTDVVSNVVSWVVVILLAVLFFFTANIGLALWLGEFFEKSYYGFFIVAGFYLLLTLICWLFRRPLIKRPVNNSLVKQLLDS
jgi:hypothetical protein